MFAEEYNSSSMVPRLLSIVEPRVVWHHMHSMSQPPEAIHCFGHFFNRKDVSKAAVHVHGVYEGSYWKLLAESDELRKTLLRLARAPEAAEVPVLCLPEGPNVPAWETFAPALQPISGNAPVPPLVLPSFRNPPVQVCSLTPHLTTSFSTHLCSFGCNLHVSSSVICTQAHSSRILSFHHSTTAALPTSAWT